MRILLINPRGGERNQQKDILFEIYQELEGHLALMMDDVEFIPNLALLSLAAYLPPSWEARFVEEDYLEPEESDAALSWPGLDLALISTVNYNARRAYHVAGVLRERGVYVVIGGLHASALPGEAAMHADTVVIGEAEEVFQEFLADFAAGNPRALYRAEKPVDLQKLPPPRYDLIENPGRFNKMPVMATRGCPHDCDFCVFPGVYFRGCRHKTVAQVTAEIQAIKALHPEPFIHFCDENLLSDRDFSRELVQAVGRLGVPWECFCDIGIGDDPVLLELLSKSRCQGLLIGLETVSPEAMQGVDGWKFKKQGEYRELIRRIQGRGLPVTGLFVIGFDQDDHDVFKNTRDFIARAGLQDMDFAVLTPIPGSRLYDRLEREGRIFSRNWARYTWTHVNFQPMHMSARQLQEGLLWIFKEFASGEMLKKREATRAFKYGDCDD
jgi:radical SAM superfamily enzyme YgiQ (UPF0313 family)